MAAELQSDYREFRLGRGAITYPDQVALAAELLRLPEVAKQIRNKHYRVLLDEAQDTDPQQFFVLLEMTRPVDAPTVPIHGEPVIRAEKASCDGNTSIYVFTVGS